MIHTTGIGDAGRESESDGNQILEQKGFRARTARIGLNRLGLNLRQIRKGVYFDGHERPDVLAEREPFLDTAAKKSTCGLLRHALPVRPTLRAHITKTPVLGADVVGVRPDAPDATRSCPPQQPCALRTTLPSRYTPCSPLPATPFLASCDLNLLLPKKPYNPPTTGFPPMILCSFRMPS